MAFELGGGLISCIVLKASEDEAPGVIVHRTGVNRGVGLSCWAAVTVVPEGQG